MIRLLSGLCMAAGGGMLLVYESLSKSERQRADRAATDAANELIHLAMGQIPPSYSDRLHQLFRHHN